MQNIKITSAAQLRILSTLVPFLSTEYQVTGKILSCSDIELLVGELTRLAPVNPRSIGSLIKLLQGSIAPAPAPVPVEPAPVVTEVQVVEPVVELAQVVEPATVVSLEAKPAAQFDDFAFEEQPVDLSRGSFSTAITGFNKQPVKNWGRNEAKHPAPKVTRDWWAITPKNTAPKTVSLGASYNDQPLPSMAQDDFEI